MKIEPKHVTQLEILGNKINEYFITNPEAMSAVFEADFGTDCAKLRVVRNSEGLEIVEMFSNGKNFVLAEGPAAKVLQQKQDALGQAASQLQQAVASIQAAQAPAQISEPPPAPAPVGPPSGPAMQPVGAAPPPPAMMPPMPAPPPVGMAPTMMPLPVMAPLPPVMAPLPPVMTPPPIAPPPPPPPAGAAPPGAGLPPEPEPLPTVPHEPGKLDPGAVQMPPGMAQGGIDAGELGDLHRQIQVKDPQGYEQEFGAVTVGNGNVPPDIPAGTEPPPEFRRRPEEEAVQLQEIPVEPADFAQMQQAYDQAITTVPHQPAKIGQVMQKITHGLGDLQGTDRDMAADMLATLAGTQEPELTLAYKKSNRKILREQDPDDAKALADVAPFQPGTSEESALVRGLKGQTVQDVSVENDEDSVKIQLTLATTKWPVIFEFTKGGKVTYTFKNRRYVLLKAWS